MSGMAEMSRAIRLVLEAHSDGRPGLKGIPTGVLRDFAEIIGALLADLKDELARRA